MADERIQRLVFGEDAELYEAARPSYPDALVADLVAWTGAEQTAVEVGAGTGKATRLVAARGVEVLAVEPDPEMAAVGRRATEGLAVRYVVSDFEGADLGGDRFPLVYAAQSWHWVDQPAGFAKARSALRDAGRLVAFWNRPVWDGVAIARALVAAYERALPDRPAVGAMHPTGERRSADREYWPQAIAEADGFVAPEVRDYAWSDTYTTERYVAMLSTISEVRLLDGARRDALLASARSVIDAHGGAFELTMSTLTAVAVAA